MFKTDHSCGASDDFMEGVQWPGAHTALKRPGSRLGCVYPRHESYVQLLTPVPALCPPSFSDSCLSMRLGQSSHARSGRAIDPSATLTSGDFLLSKISLDRNYGTITSGGKRGVVWGERSVSLSPFW